jgi:DNA replication protein DnaC
MPSQGLEASHSASVRRSPWNRHRTAPITRAICCACVNWNDIDRERRNVERRIRLARFPLTKSFDTFDFAAQPSLNKALLLKLMRCEWIDRVSELHCAWVIRDRQNAHGLGVTVFGRRPARRTPPVLDRLNHHVHILEMNGESYRLAISKNAQRRSAQGHDQNPRTPNEGDPAAKV